MAYEILGHKENLAALQHLCETQQMPHALLFEGLEGIGKKRVARNLAQTLLCTGEEPPCGLCPACRAFIQKSNPDYWEIAPEGKVQKSIRIERIRELRQMLGQTKAISKQRVVLIDGAEKMNEAAANALLKTLEEPLTKATFFLLTPSRAVLLPTIVSRTMPVHFAPLTTTEVEQVLAKEDVAEDILPALAARADGSPGKALAFEQGKGRETAELALLFLLSLPSLDMGKVWDLSAEMSSWEAEQVDEWLRSLSLLARDLLLSTEASDTAPYFPEWSVRLAPLISSLAPAQIVAVSHMALEALHRRAQNANVQMLVEWLGIRLLEICKG